MEAAAGLLPLLKPLERSDAEQLLAVCARYWTDPLQVEGDAAQRATLLREASRLVELLARRSATAMPLGALGRALLSDLHGAPLERDRLLSEFQAKLAHLGL
jgi:hypothetical protein